MSCPWNNRCPIFERLTATGDVWKATFCENKTHFENCERYRLAIKSEPVPNNMLPNGKMLRSDRGDKEDSSVLDLRKERTGK